MSRLGLLLYIIVHQDVSMLKAFVLKGMKPGEELPGLSRALSDGKAGRCWYAD